MSTNPILIDIPMPIETPRLVLRNVLPGDGEAMFEAKKESFEELKVWMPWAKEVGTTEDSEAVARKAYADFILRTDMMILGFEKTSGRLVVSTGLHRFDWERRHFEIGYWVRTSETRKGYASEAANALTRFAFAALGARKVMIHHAGGNDGSRRVIGKLGFEREGILRGESFLPDGTITDHYHYGRFDITGLPELEITWGKGK